MSTGKQFRTYAGNGETLSHRNVEWTGPVVNTGSSDPSGYLADAGLRDAVNVALTLGQPLLVTGEPGTGKTQLAVSIAHELELRPPLVFNAKTTSAARDLFYRYDALAHFRDAQIGKGATDAKAYLELECLGLAILLGMPAEKADPYLPPKYRGTGPARSVVLIDEIDKAPRDLPNDVLNEIERMEFTIRETGDHFVADPRYRPIVILTSNSEKTLPDAFLRRCIFYHIPFPDAARLEEIVQRRLGSNPGFGPDLVKSAIRHFQSVRDLGLRKPPATAELLAWLQIVTDLKIDVEHPKPGDLEALAFSYSILAKSKEDLGLLRGRLTRAPE